MKNVPTARDCMGSFFTTLRTNTDIYDAIDLLRKNGASGAPVLAENGKLAGILTEKDCLRILSNDAYQSLARGSVRDYLSEIKYCVQADWDLFRTAEEFLKTNLPVLPVMDHGELTGRISRQDMLQGIQRLQKQLRKQRDEEERELQLKTKPAGMQQWQHLAGNHKPETVAELRRNLHQEEV